MFPDEYISTYNIFKRDTKYDNTQVSNNSNTEFWQRAKCVCSHYQWSMRLKLSTLRDAIRTKDNDEI